MSNDMSNTLDDSAAVELTGKIMVAVIIVLFLVVVVVLFLHLYAKWFWWRVEDPSHPSHHSRRSSRRRFVFAPGQAQAGSALRRGLDPTLLRSLPVLVFRSDEFKEGLECAVCLSELVEGEKARMLPKCNHGFHLDCIDMWFQSHSTCPLCRNSVVPPTTSDASNSGSLSDSSVSPPLESQGVGRYSAETPNFPTNVLFWGNQARVSSGALGLDEGPSSSSTNRPDGMLVIDIPRQTAAEIFSPRSPSGSRYADEDTKSPMPTRMRSLKRLLSRGVVACSPSSVDVEQGVSRGS